MSKIWHIGDLHLNHRNVMKYRDGVSSVHENNEILVDNILSTVKKRDVLWLHGDICFDIESIEYIKRLRSGISNIKYLLGNHDFMGVSHDKRWSVIIELSKYVNFIGGIEKVKGIWLSHAPIHESELYGKINIHGHTHTNVIENRLFVNVSADNTQMFPVLNSDIRDGWRGHLWEKKYGENH